jgi:hypothetical protein
MLTFLAILATGLILVWTARSWTAGLGMRVDSVTTQLQLAARICEAAARNTCKLELSHTLESISDIDNLIERHFISELTADVVYVLGAYIGQTIVDNVNAKWSRVENDRSYPMLEITLGQFYDPFEIIARKFTAPYSVSIDLEIRTMLSTHNPTSDGA